MLSLYLERTLQLIILLFLSLFDIFQCEKCQQNILIRKIEFFRIVLKILKGSWQMRQQLAEGDGDKNVKISNVYLCVCVRESV